MDLQCGQHVENGRTFQRIMILRPLLASVADNIRPSDILSQAEKETRILRSSSSCILGCFGLP
jgi:hypothetical protein